MNKLESHGECPVCHWPVKKGTQHKHKGVKAWYHDSCYKRLTEKPAVKAVTEEPVGGISESLSCTER
jgi:hypothetical protein